MAIQFNKTMRYHVLAIVVSLAALGIAAFLAMLPYVRLLKSQPKNFISVALSTAALVALTVWMIVDFAPSNEKETPVLVGFGSLMLSLVVWSLQWIASHHEYMHSRYDRAASAVVAAAALALWSQIHEAWVSFAVAAIYFHAFFYECIAKFINQ